MPKLFVRWLVAKFLFLVYFLIIASPMFLVMHLTENHDKPTPIITGLGVLDGLVAIFAGWWLANATARHLIDDNLMFLEAMKHTWFDVRLRLAFVPVIGALFTPDEDKTKYDDDDDVRSFSPPTDS